jgi:hypothetical protein
MLIRSWRFVTVVLAALLLGLSFAHVLERPAKAQYDAALYANLQRTLYVAWGPPNVGGLLEPAAILAAAVLTVLVRREKRSFRLTLAAAAALALAFPVVFFWLVAPANEAFRAAAIPPNWIAMREQWETGHQLLAFCLLVLSLLAGPARGVRRTAGTSQPS